MTCTDIDHTGTYWTSSTVQYFKEEILDPMWSWNQPTELPTIHERKETRTVNAPHIGIMRSKRFLGNKFKLGGSKK